MKLQNQIREFNVPMSDGECIHTLPLNGPPESHFYDDKSKFNICVPTKTGSTSWLKLFYALFLEKNINPEEISSSVIYRTPQMPKNQKELGRIYICLLKINKTNVI